MPNVLLIEPRIVLFPYYAICVGLKWDGSAWDVQGRWTHLVEFL